VASPLIGLNGLLQRHSNSEVFGSEVLAGRERRHSTCGEPREAMDTEAQNTRSYRATIYVVVAVAAFLAFANTLENEFVFDDHLLLNEPSVERLGSIPGYFAGDEGFRATMGRYYRPVVSSLYCVETCVSKLLFGRSEPALFHGTNILIHMLVCLVLLRLLIRLFPRNVTACLVATLLFAVHPVHTEAVSWISGRTDSLATLFYLLSLLAYVSYRERPAVRSLVAVVVWFWIALLCKEMAVTLPAALILLDLTLGRETAPRWSRRFVVYGVLAVEALVFLEVRELLLGDVSERSTYLYFFGHDGVTTAATMVKTLPVYARLLVWPSGLLYHYDGTLAYETSLVAPRVLAAAGFVVASGCLAVGLRRRIPELSFAIVFFYLALLPVMNLVPTQSLMAERFLYLPSLLLPIAVASLLARCDRLRGFGRTAAELAPWWIIVLFAVLTVMRNQDWRDDETLFLSAEGKKGTLLNVNLGNYYARRAQEERAEALYRQALEIREPSMQAHLNLGVLYMKRADRAREAARQAENRGRRDRATEFQRQAAACFDEAERRLERARELDPLAPEPLLTLAALNQRLNRLEKCIEYLEELQQIEPGYYGSDVQLEKVRARLQKEH